MRRPVGVCVAIAEIVLVLALVAGCSGQALGSRIDGWEIGAPVACTDQWCDALLAAAVRYLDGTDPDHPAILDRSLHEWPPARDRVYSSGPPRVAVLALADGSVRAIGVKFIGVDAVPSIFAIGPDGEPVVVCNGAGCPG